MRAFHVKIENGAGCAETYEKAHSTASAVARALIECFRQGLDREDGVVIRVTPLPIGEEA